MNRKCDTTTGYRRARVGDRETELKVIVDALEAYEAKRWPLGKEPSGKG